MKRRTRTCHPEPAGEGSPATRTIRPSGDPSSRFSPQDDTGCWTTGGWSCSIGPRLEREGSVAEVLRLGVAGLGMGAGRVIPEVAKLPFMAITAGADLRKHALDRFAEEFGAEAYTSIEEMCQS